jgi:hypothetical protein
VTEPFELTLPARRWAYVDGADEVEVGDVSWDVQGPYHWDLVNAALRKLGRQGDEELPPFCGGWLVGTGRELSVVQSWDAEPEHRERVERAARKALERWAGRTYVLRWPAPPPEGGDQPRLFGTPPDE